MHRRILVWKSAAPEHTDTVIRALRDLAGRVTWESWSVGPHTGSPERSWDGALTADFATREQLDAFLTAPEHLAMVSVIRPLLDSVAAVDLDLGDPAPTVPSPGSPAGSGR